MYNKQKNAFIKFIDFLTTYDYTDYVMIIGSWAEYLYLTSKYLNGYSPNIRTLDIDVLIKNKNKPQEERNLIKDAIKEGYLYTEDTVTGTSKLYTTEDNLEIEFLINQQGSGKKSVLKTKIGVNADALRHLSILSDNSILLNILDKRISVPTPEAYVIHKIVISPERKRIKRQKDHESIINLLPFLNKKEVIRIISTLFKKEKIIVLEFAEKNPDLKKLF